ncbi:MAG: hypothetical protein JWM85_925 [Acidimicrobiaceae bacterium]|nr:hypothetical protein [Acidimicrobiaceae bacterium]
MVTETARGQAALPDAPDDAVQASRGLTRSLAIAGLALLGIVGAVLRIWAIGRAPLISDEAVVGLMAQQILHGHFSAFYWGQPYGGGEPYVVALVFAIAGQSTFTLELTPVLLDVVAVVLTWRIGRRLFTPSVGVAAAALFWIWPEAYLTESTFEYGFRWFTLCCGLGLFLLALRLADPERPVSRRRLIEWGAFGLLTGLGWWSSPEIAYFAIPSAVLLGWRLRGSGRRPRPLELGLSGTFAIIGSLPWWWANLQRGFSSLHAGQQGKGSYLLHLRVLGVHVLPIVLGVHLRAPGGWTLGAIAGVLAYVLLLAGGLLWLVVFWRRRRALVLVGFLVAFPFLYAISASAWYYGDARYAIFLAPMACLIAASGAEAMAVWLAGRSRAKSSSDAASAPPPGARSLRRARLAASVVMLLAGLGLTLGAVARVGPYVPVSGVRSSPRATWWSWRSDPVGFVRNLADSLSSAGVHDVYAGYWTAYVLGFESVGRLDVTPLGRTYARYRPLLATVERSPHPAWLFARPSAVAALSELTGSSVLDPGCAALTDPCLQPGTFEGWLRSHKIAFHTLSLGDYEAVIPERSVSPEPVLRHFGLRP